MLARSFLLLMAVSTRFLHAQELDLPKLAAEVRGSYYHPDGLTGLNCTVTFDWDSVAKQMGMANASDRLKMLKGMVVNAHALRNKPVRVDIDWTQGSVPNKEAVEAGLKQGISGYFQMYWPIAGAAITPLASTATKAESKAGGGYVLVSIEGAMKLTTEVGADRTIARIIIDSPIMKSTITPSFSASPKAVPGDLRRMTAIDVAQQTGTNVMNVHMTMDYQTVDGFHVPKSVVFAIGGAFSMNLEFAACRQVAD
jgi:hypothetical protein